MVIKWAWKTSMEARRRENMNLTSAREQSRETGGDWEILSSPNIFVNTWMKTLMMMGEVNSRTSELH
ncbi:hypothetical protein O6P43_024091 [Quillaja saponaria]|uniref:Uncharacterized protein n=1 Tax=Quillaja saponaria TaxID=32244 RepID=A0AAD7PER7_QUISA|nr:hypothetical protein O6P43_024091 [Quillaja saponaria]